MNSAVRTWFLRHVEVPLLRRLGGSLEGMTVLEIGCGRGTGTQLVLEQLQARRIVALDIDPAQVLRARRRLSRLAPDAVTVLVGDATSLPADTASVDAVVDLAALHHVPDWQAALAEVARVLKPDGLFLFEEVTRRWLERWFARTFFVHPQENRFTTNEFVAELERLGIAIGSNYVERGHGDYVFGAGRRVARTLGTTALDHRSAVLGS